MNGQPAIVIAGGGPVGMCAAIEAARQGVSVTLIEQRPEGLPPSAKCNTVAARTMETFRRFGFADQIRAAGLPDDYPTDTIYTTSITGPELTRIRMPARSERAMPGFADSHWRTPEPMVRVSQIYVEPIIQAHLRTLPNITVLYQTSVTGYQQDAEGVDVQCTGADGAAFTLRASYLLGADGGRSVIRKTMGVKLSGDAELAHTRSSLIRAPGLRALWGDRRPAWMSWVVNHKVRGNVVAIDGKDTWLVHRALPQGERNYETLDMDQSIRDVLGVGKEFAYEVLNHEDWVGRRLVAERMRDGRVFLAGDAAHLWIPYAGYGMNAGIADGTHLAWLLSQVIQGWASPHILDAYEAERHPITEQVSRHAMQSMLDSVEAMGNNAVPVALSSRFNPIGAGLRTVLGAKLFKLNVPQFAPEGLNFGYYYDKSPIICYDGEKQPDYTMGSITASTVPGCRMPHFSLTDGSSVYDKLGPAYTLLRFSPQANTDALETAAKEADMPLKVLNIPLPQDLPEFSHALLMVRQDQHVVWRGNSIPHDSARLIALLCGRSQ